MKHRFLIHLLSHTVLIVDISEIGPLRINPRAGNTQMVPALRFVAWREASQYLTAKGANAEALEQTSAQLQKTGQAVLTVV
jgi:hypothetical protein